MWAVEQMNNNKIVSYYDVHYKRFDDDYLMSNDNGYCKWIPAVFKEYHFNSNNWVVVEEPKKTLYNKQDEAGRVNNTVMVFKYDDIKEALKEYIGKVKARYNQYFNNEKESNYNNKIFEDAKDIFGEELLR